MPKGLIPLIGGLGVAGAMVGISIPSAVTVIPKKINSQEKQKPVEQNYTGFVYNGKIYENELNAKQALLTDIKNHNPIKTPAVNGEIQYEIDGLDAKVSGLHSPWVHGTAQPSPTTLKTQYSFDATGTSVTLNEESTIVSIQAPKFQYPGFTEFNDFKYSLKSVDSDPQEKISNIDLGSYIGTNIGQVHLSGEQIYSAADKKFYWYADAPNSGLYGADAAHHNVMWTNESLVSTNTWGEAPAPGTANAAKIGIKFDSSLTSKAAGKPIFIYTSLTEAQIKNETVSYNGQNFKYHAVVNSGGSTNNVYLRYMNIMLTATSDTAGDRPGHGAMPGTKFSLKDSSNNVVGYKSIAGNTAPTLSDSNIKIVHITNPVPPVMWDMDKLNNSPNELSKITKEVVHHSFNDGDSWPIVSSTTSTSYLYNEEVLND